MKLVYMENPRESIKLLELSGFIKVARYKVNIQNYCNPVNLQ